MAVKVISVSEQKAEYAEMGNTIKHYLADMNVKPQLYDDMLYISPANMRILSTREIENYGLVRKDPFEEEAKAAQEIKRFGISCQEYEERSERINTECTSTADYKALIACGDDVLEGRR